MADGGKGVRGDDLRDESVYEQLRRDQELWRRARVMGLSRRRFLAMLAAGGASAALPPSAAGLRRIARAAPVPPRPMHVKPTPSELFIPFGSNMEMRWD